MKNIKLIFLSILVLLMYCTEKEEEVNFDEIVFSGVIINSSKDSLNLYLNQEKVHSIAIDSSGTFSDTFELEDGFYTLRIGAEFTNVYLTKGSHLTLKIDENNFDESLEYNGGANENNYLAQKVLQEIKLRNVYSPMLTIELSETDFLAKLDSIENVKLALLKSQDSLSSSFTAMEEKIINYETKKEMLMYPLYMDYYKPENEYVVSENYPKPLKKIPLDDESLAQHKAYLNLLQEKFILVNEEEIEGNDSIDAKVNLIQIINEQVANKVVKESFLYYVVKNEINYAEDVEAYFSAFSQVASNEENIAKIATKYNKLKLISKGQFSPSFAFRNIDGETTSLEDLRGKLVYIDLWATWCGPCLREIPALKALESEMHDEDIHFVSIASNCDKEDWKNMLVEKELGGIQLFAEEDEQDFHAAYIVNSIPRFILLDKEGKIIDSNAKRPSNPELKEEIQSYF